MLGSLFNKVLSLKIFNFLKNRLQHRCFLWILQTFLRKAFLYNASSGCFWQSYHDKVKSAGVPVLWFRTSTWSRKVAQIILYHHMTKLFLACLNWLTIYFWYKNVFWKTLIAFDFDEKFTQSVAEATVISHAKILSSPALWGWSGAFNFRVWFWKWKNSL